MITPLRLYSNFEAYDNALKDVRFVSHVYIGPYRSVWSTITMALEARKKADYLVLNIDHRRLFITAIIFGILSPRPFRRCRLVSVDVLLRPALGRWQRVQRFIKRLLLQQVDLFLLYFKNVDGYVREYGLSPDRLSYVPFKVNSYDKVRSMRLTVREGEYALLAGATFRDHATFAEAVRMTGLPSLLLLPRSAYGKVESAPWYVAPPPSMTIAWHTDGKEETYLSYFARARLVILPRYSWDIASSGISACLCAMALGRTVLISEGPGANDILTNGEALFFKAGDAEGLAKTMNSAWHDPALRQQISTRAIRYSDSLQGEETFLRRILDKLLENHVPTDMTSRTRPAMK